jgi:hypothetical protein
MKTLLNILVLTLLLFAASSPCFALRSIGILSKQEATKMGIQIRATAAGPDAAWVELEFKPEGRLKDFSHVELEINDGEKLLVAYAPLREVRLASGSIVVRFMANRAYLEKVTLCVVEGPGTDVGHELRLKDFIEVEKIR